MSPLRIVCLVIRVCLITLVGIYAFTTLSASAASRSKLEEQQGLRAEYYNDIALTDIALTRRDSVIDFDWGGGSPDPFIQADTFSARWTGRLKGQFSEVYSIYLTADDGVRLWIGGQLVIDAWIDQPPTEWFGIVVLTADELQDIQLEYYENGGGAMVRLEWESASQPRQVIPPENLLPPLGASAPPSVELVQPGSNDSFVDPPNILLRATATDTDGAITRVEFFANGNLIGEALSEPFELTWSDMDPMNYVLHARATDDAGEVTLSAPVPISITTIKPIGLEAEYFNNMSVSPPAALLRRDLRIDFDWSGGSPDPLIAPDGFSARWTGSVVPEYSDLYTFIVEVDDGVRLWIDGELVIDSWIDQAPTRHEGYITLTAGHPHDLELEFYENGGGALIRLLWSSLNVPEEVIPTARLQPPGPGNRRPRTPRITEPFMDGQLVNFSDVHIETAPFHDPNPEDTHVCSDFEIWTVNFEERVWVTECIGGVEKVHTHLGDGTFEGSLAGKSELLPETQYVLRARHRDDSGDPDTEWSPWAQRYFVTTSVQDPIPGQPEWIVNQPGFKVERFATGFQLPVGMAFLPEPGPDPSDPFLYVAELYGAIKMVTRDGTVTTYAEGLLNFDPTGAFPGSGEQGLGGIVVEPKSGDLFITLLYSSVPGVESAPHYPRILRLHSEDGGRTASAITTVFDMPGETQGQSHQISSISIGPDGMLYVHMGDGFDASTAQDLGSFRGKILRLTLEGEAPDDNPFYDASDGLQAADYIYAQGFRNPFGGTWRAADGQHYSVENGPSIDRFARIDRGINYLWDGSDFSMFNYAIFNWIPAAAPVNIAFIQNETFGGSGFPMDKLDHAFVSESGPTWASGPQFSGKRISEFVLDQAGNLIAGPAPLIEYNGPGKATVVALAAGPDGLYFSDFYKDREYTSPIDRGSNVLRVRWTGANRPPVAVLDWAERQTGANLRLRVEKILVNDSDVDGDPVEFTGVDPLSASGGTVSVEGNTIIYVPPEWDPFFDQITYHVADGKGGDASGTLFVTTDLSQEYGGVTLLGIEFLPGDAGARIRFAAIPRRAYKVEFTDILTVPFGWSPLGIHVAGSTGILTLLDPAAGRDGGRLYRLLPTP